MPLAADAIPDRPLAESIAVATRSAHTRLNKSIIARLPLITRAPDPSCYITGLLHIAPVYLTFEACWNALLEISQVQNEVPKSDRRSSVDALVEDSLPSTATAHTTLQLQEPVVCDGIRTLLQQLRLPGLMRSSCLRADIRALTGWPEHVVEEQMRLAGETGRLGEFTAHIKRSIEHRPHVLIAYSYILYMALFAGGRFIRATLDSIGDAFWSETPSPIKPSMLECKRQPAGIDHLERQASEAEISPMTDETSEESATPLSFFHFATPEDGEDLKRQFKSLLLDAESLLTRHEKQDIIQESICIFDNMELLLSQLDQVCVEGQDSGSTGSMENLSALMGKSMTMRLRDSVAVTKDRAARFSSRMTSSSDSDSLCSVVKGRKGHGSDGATSAAELNSVGIPGHPLVPSAMGMPELCPATKSMRFESNLPIPVRTTTDIKQDMKEVHYTNWLFMAAFGAIVIGAIITTRREMITA